MMNKEIANKQKVLLTYDGIELWLNEEKWKKLEYALDNQIGNFYEIEGRRVAKSNITGIWFPIDIEDLKRRKNGQWKCGFSVWHNRGEHCNCKEIENAKEHNRKNTERMKDASENLTDEQIENNRKRIKGMRDKIFNNKNVW